MDMRTVYRTASAAATLLACACSLSGCGSWGPERAAAPPVPAAERTASELPATEDPLVVFLGDSLTAGYGLSADRAFPALVAQALRDQGAAGRIVNAGVSGDTTAGGLARLDWILKQEPAILVVGLGGNDALRGQPLENVEQNLRAIVSRGRLAGARVLLLGQRIPTNYGPDYSERFAAIYPRVAREAGAKLMPFVLEGVGGRPALNLPDGIHPNARGHEIIAQNVAPYVEELLRETAPR
jgi:acyl-CoA thioesterase-1